MSRKSFCFTSFRATSSPPASFPHDMHDTSVSGGRREGKKKLFLPCFVHLKRATFFISHSCDEEGREKSPRFSPPSLTDILIRRGRGRERKGDGSPFRVFTRCIIFGGIFPFFFLLFPSSFFLPAKIPLLACSVYQTGKCMQMQACSFFLSSHHLANPGWAISNSSASSSHFFMLELLELESFRCRTT